MTEKITAIVLAGGKGKRMGTDRPKQYLELYGHPVLYYSLRAFQDAPRISEIVLVTGRDEMDWCRKTFAESEHMDKIAHIVEGGRERWDSVYEGLKAAGDSVYVLIHDGARPLLTSKIIEDSIEAVQVYDACVAAVPVKDTIKIADSAGFAIDTPDRSALWQIQTPQSFSLSLIRKAYDQLKEMEETGGPDWENLHITDDAMAAETFLKTRVKLIPGSYSNIKITTPEDMILAEALLEYMGFC